MPRCQATKPDGSPCERIVKESQRFCYSHDDTRSKQRSAAASKAAKSKGPAGELNEIKSMLRGLAGRVLNDTIDRADAAVIGQQQNELEVQLAELRQYVANQSSHQSRRGGYGRWGG